MLYVNNITLQIIQKFNYKQELSSFLSTKFLDIWTEKL